MSMTTLKHLLNQKEEKNIPAIHRELMKKEVKDLTIKDLSDVGLTIIQAEYGFIPDGINIGGEAYKILFRRAQNTKQGIL